MGGIISQNASPAHKIYEPSPSKNPHHAELMQSAVSFSTMYNDNKNFILKKAGLRQAYMFELVNIFTGT